MGLLDDIKDIFTSDGDEMARGKNNKLLRNIIILGMIGTLLLLFGNVFVSPGNNNQQQIVSPVREERNTDENDYEKRLTDELEEIIGLIQGVGRVKVKIYITGYTEYQYEYNTSRMNKITNETDQNGGEREVVEDNSESELVIITDPAGNEQPVIRHKILPDIKGVLIVAQGAENGRIKNEIIRSVSSLLNIPIYKINVLPYERG
ncbi:MAG: stage III sporulation protein AG [Halanaerobiales bacterium]